MAAFGRLRQRDAETARRAVSIWRYSTIETFNRKFRDECLNEHWWVSWAEA